MNNITFNLFFIKNKALVDYAWEQPNVPFFVCTWQDSTKQFVKVLCDFNKKRVYVKLIDDGKYRITPIQNLFCTNFNIPAKDIIGRYDECFYDLIDDLKRNLHNKQGQLIKFEIQPNQFGFSKVGKIQNWPHFKF